MEEDDDDLDLEACWADVRGPRPKPPPPPPAPPRPEQVPERRHDHPERLRVLLSQPQELEVRVGLFTDRGEVSGAGYRRIEARMHIENGTATFGQISFPEAGSDWGAILTAGIFSTSGEALFYVDLQRSSTILASDTLNLNLNVSID